MDAAGDQTSLSATAARYILGILKEAEATPEAFDPRMPHMSNKESPSTAPSKKFADYGRIG